MAERNRESVAAKGRGLWKRVAPLLVLTAEVSGLATFVGALFSIIFNSIAFQAMGLNFVEIATPSDLLMSGIKLTGTLLMVILVCLAGALPIYLFLRYVPLIRDAKPRIWKILFTAALLVFMFGVLVDAAPIAGFYPVIPRVIEQSALLVYFPLLALAWLLRRPESSQRWRIAAIVTIVAVIAVQFSGTVYWSYSFARSNLVVRFEGGEEACGGPSRALWIGTSSVVVECGALKDHRDISVVERSTVQIIPREAYFARRGVELFAARRYFDPFKERDWRPIGSMRDGAGESMAYPIFLDISDVVREGKTAVVWVASDIRAVDSEGPVVIDVAVQCDMDSIQPRAVFLREGGFMTAATPSDILGETRTLPKSVADVACRTDLSTLPKSDFAVPRTLAYPDREAARSANEL